MKDEILIISNRKPPRFRQNTPLLDRSNQLRGVGRLPAYKGCQKFSLMSVGSIVMSAAVYYPAKFFVTQQRPNEKNDHSFPSGHVVWMMVAVCTLVFYTLKFMFAGRRRPTYIKLFEGLTWGLVLLVAAFSVLAQYHYIGDTTASICMVLVCFMATTNLFIPKEQQISYLNTLTQLAMVINASISNPSENLGITGSLAPLFTLTGIINICRFPVPFQGIRDNKLRRFIKALPVPLPLCRHPIESCGEVLFRTFAFVTMLGAGAVNLIPLISDFDRIPLTAIAGYKTGTEQEIVHFDVANISPEQFNKLRTYLVVAMGLISGGFWVGTAIKLLCCFNKHHDRHHFSPKIHQNRKMLFVGTSSSTSEMSALSVDSTRVNIDDHHNTRMNNEQILHSQNPRNTNIMEQQDYELGSSTLSDLAV